MIRKIRVNGFRSLIGFEIDMTSGLNVLVGANGTGKSNFISFLDFLGVFLQTSLNPAIAVGQGAGSVFSKELFNDTSAELSFRIEGNLNTATLPSYFHVGKESKGIISYEYECKIHYIRKVPAVYVGEETIRIHTDSKSILNVIRKTDIKDGGFKHSISIEDISSHFSKHAFSWIKQGKTKDFDAKTFLTQSTRPDMSILRTIAHGYQPAVFVLTDIIGYRSINIDPSIARRPTPVGTSSKLQPTGEGLAGVLYQLEQGTYQAQPSFFYRPPDPTSAQKTKFESIMSWCREVNPDIARVGVELDFHEAELKPSITFQFNEKLEKFPLNRVSDGTVKWLALASILFLNEELSVIEEPENFLHPFMQETFVSLCRHVLDGVSRFIVISTHSPTLLDCCDPSEVIIFETVNGQTRASRVVNKEELRTKIANSRFGLGYYYRTGGLYGEDRSAG